MLCTLQGRDYCRSCCSCSQLPLISTPTGTWRLTPKSHWSGYRCSLRTKESQPALHVGFEAFQLYLWSGISAAGGGVLEQLPGQVLRHRHALGAVVDEATAGKLQALAISSAASP